MRNKKFTKFSILGLLLGAISLVAFSDVLKNIIQVDSYTKDGQLATTIDLRDNTEEEIKDYYSALTGKSASELQGNNLLKNLKPILKNGQKYFAYDSSGDDIWKMYEIIDRDWEKSPASAITGYSASTNKITGYKYGTSTSNKGTNPYIHALYVDRNVDNQTRAWDDHQQTQWGINREHIWPKSQGFDTSGAGGARGDPMHLWAGNGRVNGTEHNNNMYGFVDKSKAYTNPFEAKSFKNLKDNYSGKSLTMPTSTDTVFEPQDCDKGDIARAIFYMVARYNNLAGNDTIDTNNPNLALKQTTEALSSYTTTSSNKQTGYMGLMTDLLYWNHLDPVDEFEIHRNNLLFNNYTHNRNPFIDYPEWADYIWGKPTYNGRNYVSYSSTPTGSVNLSTDVINGFKGEQPTQNTVVSIEISKKPTKLVYNAGETFDPAGMVVKARMSNNTSRTLSSDEYTVSPSGTLTTENNTVTVTYDGKMASFSIGVKDTGGATQTDTKTLSFNLTSNPGGWPTANSTTLTNYNYLLDETNYSFGLKNVKCNSGYLMLTSTAVLGLPAISNYKLTKVVASNSSGCSTSVIVGVSSSASSASYIAGGATQTWSKQSSSYTYNLTSTQVNTVYYLYVTNKNAQIINLDLTYECTTTKPSNIDVTSITLNKNTETLDIGQSENLTATIQPTNATIKLVSWSSSNSPVVDVNDEGEIIAISAGTATITCSALDGSGVTATCTVTVNAPVVLTSISLSGQYATEFYLGDTFSTEGMTVMANYSDGSEVDITDDIEISGYDTNTEGIQTVTISYGDTFTTYTIEVKEKGLDDNQLMFTPSQYGLVNGDDLTSYTESIATLTFNKNSGSQPKFYTSSMSFRIYAKNSFTIVGTKNITKIEFEMSSGDTVGNNVITANIGSFSNNVWIGESNLITFSVGGTSGQRNIVSIKVTYDLQSADVVMLKSISANGTYKTEFFVGESFTYEGLVVTAYYSDDSSKEVTPTSVSSPVMSTAGQKTITISYSEDGITIETTYIIDVIAVVTEYITLSGNYKTTFIKGEEYDSTGLRITEHYNNGGTSAAHYPTSQGCTITGYDMNVVGEQTVTVSWNGVSTTYTINVLARPSIKVPSYVEGWFLVNDVSNLEVGGIYTFASVAKKSVALPMGDNKYFSAIQKSDNVELTNVSFDGDMMTPDEGIEPVQLTLGGESGKWTFTDETGLIGTSAAKTLNHNGSGTTTWNISFDEDNAIIASTSGAYGSIQFNSGSPRFLNYTSGQSPISLFRFEQKRTDITFTASFALSQAIVSAQEILDAECLSKKVTAKNWEKIEAAIVPFLKDSTSDDYKALMFGEAVSSEVDGNILEDFLARYDLIVSTYGYENFIKDSNNTRNIRATARTNNFDILSIDNDTTITCVIVLCGIVAIGSFVLTKKRKEN